MSEQTNPAAEAPVSQPQSIPVDASVKPEAPVANGDAAAATAASAFDTNAESRRVALVARASAAMNEIVSSERDAAIHRATKGYKLALENARRYGFELADLAAWLPQTANKDASGIELAVRQLSDQAIPSGGHTYIRGLARMQRLVVDASEPSHVAAAQKLNKAVVERRQFKSNKPSKAAGALKSATEAQELYDAAVAKLPDDERARWEKCRTDPEALAQLARDLNAGQQENSRWRNSLFVPFIHQHLSDYVSREQNTQDGNAPDIDNSSIGKLWQPASAAAYRTVTTAVAEAHAAKAGELVSVDVVSAAIAKAVTDTIGAVAARETAKQSIEQIRTKLQARLATTLDRMKDAEINLLDDAGYLEVKAICDKHNLFPKPKAKDTSEQDEALKRQQEAEQQAKAAAQQKTAEAVATEEQARKDNAELAQAVAANAANAAAPATEAPAEETDEQRIARMKEVMASKRGKVKADATSK